MKSGVWSPRKRNACAINEKAIDDEILKRDQWLLSLHVTENFK
jgi:hypothetical protein